MAAIFFLLFVSPVIGLQCLHSSCSMDETELGKCHLQDEIITNCSQGSRCGRKIRITSQTELRLIGVPGLLSDAPTSSGVSIPEEYTEKVSTYRVFYERLCVDDTTRCHANWNCSMMDGKRDCRQTLCCNASLCNRNTPVFDNSLLERFVNGDNLNVNPTVPTASESEVTVNRSSALAHMLSSMIIALSVFYATLARLYV